MESAVFNDGGPAKNETRHFVSATPAASHDRVLLDLIGIPGSAPYERSEAFYARGEYDFLQNSSEDPPSVLCEFSARNGDQQNNLSARLAKTESCRVNGAGYLFNLYMVNQGPAPMWFYSQPNLQLRKHLFTVINFLIKVLTLDQAEAEPDQPQIFRSIAKFVTGGANGWRRYKMWRADVRSRSAHNTKLG